jgi:hypothetical protein
MLGSVSDLPGLRLSLPLQSRPAHISDGTHDSTEQLEFSQEHMATVACRLTSTFQQESGHCEEQTLEMK